MTPRRWWGVAVLGAAVVMFTQAGTVCCTPEARAPIERKLSDALTDEQLACMLATHAGGPNDVHTAIVTACGIGPELTGFAVTLLQMADRMHLGAARDAGGP